MEGTASTGVVAVAPTAGVSPPRFRAGAWWGALDREQCTRFGPQSRTVKPFSRLKRPFDIPASESAGFKHVLDHCPRMGAEETIREYYEALRRGEPLYPYFAERDDATKFGVGERLVGYDAIAEGLREQSRTTDDWTVESSALRVVERDDVARFTDDVALSWTDVEADERRSFDTRWSGTLERHDGEWLFTSMHVSAPHEL